jgi:uncharacterized protein with HEPN domain
MRRDDAYLLDILDASRLALEYISETTFQAFLRDVKSQDAVIRRFIVIGEAARRISPETRSRYPQLPWSEMVSMRNLVVHDYDDIDLPILWDTANQDLPKLIAMLEEIGVPGFGTTR